MTFKLGDRVRLSQLAKDSGIGSRTPRDRVGTVVGFSVDYLAARVRWDGLSRKTLESYDATFLDLVEAGK